MPGSSQEPPHTQDNRSIQSLEERLKRDHPIASHLLHPNSSNCYESGLIPTGDSSLLFPSWTGDSRHSRSQQQMSSYTFRFSPTHCPANMRTCVCTQSYMLYVEGRGQLCGAGSLYLYADPRDQTLGHQACRKVILSTEPPCRPRAITS